MFTAVITPTSAVKLNSSFIGAKEYSNSSVPIDVIDAQLELKWFVKNN
jgi:hypothetical protein